MVLKITPAYCHSQWRDDDLELRAAIALVEVDGVLRQHTHDSLTHLQLQLLQQHLQDLVVLSCSRFISNTILQSKGIPSEQLSGPRQWREGITEMIWCPSCRSARTTYSAQVHAFNEGTSQTCWLQAGAYDAASHWTRPLGNSLEGRLRANTHKDPCVYDSMSAQVGAQLLPIRSLSMP